MQLSNEIGFTYRQRSGWQIVTALLVCDSRSMNRMMTVFCSAFVLGIFSAYAEQDLVYPNKPTCPKISVMNQFAFDKSKSGLDIYKTPNKAVVLVVSCNEKVTSNTEEIIAGVKDMGAISRMNPDEFMLEIKKPDVFSRTYYKVGKTLLQYAFSTKKEDVKQLENLHSSVLKDIRKLRAK